MKIPSPWGVTAFFPQTLSPWETFTFCQWLLPLEGRLTPELRWMGGRFKIGQMDHQYLPTAWSLRARLSNCTPWYWKMCFRLETLSVGNASPHQSLFSRILPPPSNWLSISFLRALNWMFSLAKTCHFHGRITSKKERRSDLCKAPFWSRSAFPFVAQGGACG